LVGWCEACFGLPERAKFAKDSGEIDMKAPVLRRLFTACKTGVLAGALCFFLSEARADTIDFGGTFTSVTLFGPPTIYPLWAAGDTFEGSINFTPTFDVTSSDILINSSITGGPIIADMGAHADFVFDQSTGALFFESFVPDNTIGFDSHFEISIPPNRDFTPPDNIFVGASEPTTPFSGQNSTGVINSVTVIVPESGTTFALLGIGIFCLLTIRRFFVC
jgi:VPDSG-CTERM motif